MDLQSRLPSHLRRPPPDVERGDLVAVTEAIQRALSAGGLNSRSALSASVTDTIQRALSAAGLSGSSATVGLDTWADVPIEERPTTLREQEVDVTGPEAGMRQGLQPHLRQGGSLTPTEQAPPGQFVRRSFASDLGTWSYKVYVPTSYGGEPVPVVVMLHGCTQSPDDFAAGTRMNALAEQHGFLAVYPAQAAKANGSKCWNWFRSKDQGRDTGEPAVIVGIVREVAANYRVDERRIFVAGLSAGGALAVILGATYADLFAAVGAHSGLPYGAAHDLPSALSAMKGSGPRTRRRPARLSLPPTIVFHGDEDSTVHLANGAAIVEQATGFQNRAALGVELERGATQGRDYTRITYSDEAGRPVVEHWVVKGAGHAWSGGSPSGSFTDAEGPDASAEMVRFFYAQRAKGQPDGRRRPAAPQASQPD